MTQEEQPLYLDPMYVQGQIAATKALLLAIAQVLPKQQFRQLALERLEMARTAAHAEPVSDSYLIALDLADDWVKHVTS